MSQYYDVVMFGEKGKEGIVDDFQRVIVVVW